MRLEIMDEKRVRHQKVERTNSEKQETEEVNTEHGSSIPKNYKTKEKNSIMERLDQGHLHHLEVPMSRPGSEPGPPRWEESTLTKSYLNIVLKAFSIRNIHI
jgi:hypothetical protein